MQGRHRGCLDVPEQRVGHVIEMNVDDSRHRRPLALRPRASAGRDCVANATIKQEPLPAHRPQGSAGDGVAAGEERHLVRKENELLGKIGDDHLRIC